MNILIIGMAGLAAASLAIGLMALARAPDWLCHCVGFFVMVITLNFLGVI
jgi:hypothetical protein